MAPEYKPDGNARSGAVELRRQRKAKRLRQEDLAARLEVIIFDRDPTSPEAEAFTWPVDIRKFVSDLERAQVRYIPTIVLETLAQALEASEHDRARLYLKYGRNPTTTIDGITNDLAVLCGEQVTELVHLVEPIRTHVLGDRVLNELTLTDRRKIFVELVLAIFGWSQ